MLSIDHKLLRNKAFSKRIKPWSVVSPNDASSGPQAKGRAAILPCSYALAKEVFIRVVYFLIIIRLRSLLTLMDGVDLKHVASKKESPDRWLRHRLHIGQTPTNG